ncbi:MAG: ComF family protein [Bacteroidales bacterium]|nr:ComF family protein [Bacteroidales bacterium]MBQ9701970.1 ComF family protein [Bacteroidales bacterium]MBR1782422.1 ComF family protein [Bacteroidales bacterium]
MWKELTDLLMPRTCLVCGAPLGAQEAHLCLSCEAHLPLTYYWERPHNPMADEFNAVLERHRLPGEALPYSYATGLLFYHHQNPYKRIPQALKYGRDAAAGRHFGALLGRYLATAPHFADVDAVIPVPLHWLRRLRRGYNQAAVLSEAIAGVLGVPVLEDVLVRARRTRSQTSLSAEDRLKNVSGVFSVRRAPQARHILLVDDTFTTGATLAACHQALRRVLDASARISIATLAVVDT